MTHIVVGIGLAVLGAILVWRLMRHAGPSRAGPWPGLTFKGAGLLLAHALLLAGGQVLLPPRSQRGIAELIVQSVLAMAPLALATRLVRLPGAASAVCGAYLLPRTLASVLEPSLELPTLLIAPAIAFDIVVWLRPSDLAAVREAWPGQRRVWQRRVRAPRHIGRWRATLAGATFGALFVPLEAAFAVYLGTEPVGADVAITMVASLGCALVGAIALARDVEQRYRQERPHNHS